jgi:hypothetical protein
MTRLLIGSDSHLKLFNYCGARTDQSLPHGSELRLKEIVFCDFEVWLSSMNVSVSRIACFKLWH